MPFWNQNGLGVSISVFSVRFEEYRFSCKKCPKFEKNLDLESISLELSKNDLRMSSRHLVRFLCSHPHPHAFPKNAKNDDFFCFSCNFEDT